MRKSFVERLNTLIVQAVPESGHPTLLNAAMFSFLVILSFLVYYLASVIYYVTFHPLADIPGPKICAFSRIPYWRASMRGEDVQWMKKLHDKYGPVVRFGPTDLSYTSAQAWQDVHGPKVQEKAQEFSVQPVNGSSAIKSTFLLAAFWI